MANEENDDSSNFFQPTSNPKLPFDDAVRLHREFFVDLCHSFCLRQQLTLQLHVYQTVRERIDRSVVVQHFHSTQDIDNQTLYRVVCREQFAELCCAREKKKVFYDVYVMNL